MTRNPDRPCSGGCGRLCWRTAAPTSICQECRRTRTEKRCPDCGEVKPIDAFSVKRNKASGRDSYCKPCHAARTRAYQKRTGWTQQRAYTTSTCIDCGAVRRVRVDNGRTPRPRCHPCSQVRRRGPRWDTRVKVSASVRLRVLNRDRWRCGICRKRISRKLRWPDPRSAVVDHVVAVANGGAHEESNMQAAHNECNAAKAASGQMALFGAVSGG